MKEITRGEINRAINELETITYHKHHYVRKTGLKKLIKDLFDVDETQLWEFEEIEWRSRYE